jgi:hypothetical protein
VGGDLRSFQHTVDECIVCLRSFRKLRIAVDGRTRQDSPGARQSPRPTPWVFRTSTARLQEAQRAGAFVPNGTSRGAAVPARRRNLSAHCVGGRGPAPSARDRAPQGRPARTWQRCGRNIANCAPLSGASGTEKSGSVCGRPALCPRSDELCTDPRCFSKSLFAA